MKHISVVGLGKLGLPLTLTLASKGFRVIGYDTNKKIIEKLQSGISPIPELHVQDYMSKNRSYITFTLNPEELIKKSDISFIVVPTPSAKNGSFSSQYIKEAFRAFMPYLKQKKNKHTFVITSTISPGTMEEEIKPLIEKGTQKKIGEEIGLCYSPELIALGSVIRNLTNPDFLFIGESDPASGKTAEKLRRAICDNSPQVIRTKWINVEIAKLALNAYITTKISFANMIARISERVPGADSEIILNAIGQDSRVGVKYLRGGLGFGGPCFPRDNLSLYSTIKKIGLDIKLPLNIDNFNRKQIDYVYEIVRKHCKKGKIIGILGLSYKPETDVIDESQGMLLAEKFIKNKITVAVFDPLVLENERKELRKALFMKTMGECVQKSDVIVLATPWDQFKGINWDTYKGKVIIDCWRHIDTSKYDQVQNTFVQLGRYISTP